MKKMNSPFRKDSKSDLIVQRLLHPKKYLAAVRQLFPADIAKAIERQETQRIRDLYRIVSVGNRKVRRKPKAKKRA